MAYIPKHKINILETLGGEFITKMGKKPYSGPYIETADGKYYAGDNPFSLDNKARLEKILKDALSFKFKNIPPTRIYNIINKKYKKNLEKLKPLLPSKEKPTEKDYKKFKYKRYFAKRINSQFGYFEIDQKSHKSLKTKKPEFDTNLYTIGEIEWAIVGDTQIINLNTLKLEELKHPGLSLLFKNLKEYKSTKDSGIFKKLEGYDPYKKEGITTSQLRAAIDFTNSQKDIQSPEELIDPDNFILYNIRGRQYIDGVSIPNNLPKAYGLPRPINKVLIENQNCHYCYFNKGGLCTYWKASIRHNFWCAAWVNYQAKELTYQEFQDQVSKTINTSTTTVSSIGDVTLNDQSLPTPSSPSTGGGNSSGGGGGGY